MSVKISMRQYQRKKLNKSSYSAQTSVYPSMQTTPRSASRPNQCVTNIKSNVGYLSNEIKKHKRTRTELKENMELGMKYRETLDAKISKLKEQLQFVIQQNTKLETAKISLIDELQSVIDNKKAITEQKKNAKVSHENKIKNIYKDKRKIAENYIKEVREITNNIQKEKETRILIIKDLKESQIRVRELHQLKHNNHNDFGKEIDILSYVVNLS